MAGQTLTNAVVSKKNSARGCSGKLLAKPVERGEAHPEQSSRREVAQRALFDGGEGPADDPRPYREMTFR